MDMSDHHPLINRADPRSVQTVHAYVRACLAEFLATALFVFLGTMATTNVIVGVALAHALALGVLVAATAKISGGHLNPVVSLAVCLAGEIGPVKAALYAVSQVLGGLTGAGLTRLALPYDVYVGVKGGGHLLGDGVTIGEGFVCEIFLTAVLVLVVLLTAVDRESQTAWAPLAIGLAVGADILAGGAVTGASMNPARSLGPAVAASTVGGVSSDLWSHHYIYWVAPALGACFSALWYRLVFACPEKNLLMRRTPPEY